MVGSEAVVAGLWKLGVAEPVTDLAHILNPNSELEPKQQQPADMDLMLMLLDPSSPSADPRNHRCICVGVFKLEHVEVLDDVIVVDQGPYVDFVAAWNHPQHRLHTEACAITSQLLTHMQLLKVRAPSRLRCDVA